MPVEIKELHIKVNVNPPGEQASPAAPASVDNASETDKETMVSQLVEQIMELIKNKDER